MALDRVPDRLIPATGERAEVEGKYRCLGCGFAIRILAGEDLPACRRCVEAVNWILVERFG